MQGQLELRVLHLPSGKDPVSSSNRTEPAITALLDQAPLWLDWQIVQCWRSAISAGPTSSSRRSRPWWGFWANCPSRCAHPLPTGGGAPRWWPGTPGASLEDDLRQQVKANVGMGVPAVTSSRVNLGGGSAVS